MTLAGGILNLSRGGVPVAVPSKLENKISKLQQYGVWLKCKWCPYINTNSATNGPLPDPYTRPHRAALVQDFSECRSTTPRIYQ